MKAYLSKLAGPEYAPSFELLTDEGANSKRLAVLTHTDSDTAEEIAEAWNSYNPEHRLLMSSFLDSIIQGDYTLSDAITEATQLKTLLKMD